MLTGRPGVTVATVNAVSGAFAENPKQPLRQVAETIGNCLSTVYAVAKKKLKLKPYKMQIVQALKPQDRPNRLAFAEIVLERDQEEPGYVEKIVLSDETVCSFDGVVNRHNCRIWGSENPHVTHEKQRCSPKVNV